MPWEKLNKVIDDYTLMIVGECYEDEEKNIFVHFSSVKKSGLKYLEEGEQLTFEIKNSDKGPSAISLQKVINLQKAPVLKLVKKN